MSFSRYLSKLAAFLGSDGKVPTAGIADGAVTMAKITDANITQAKLAAGVAGNGPAFFATRSSGGNQVIGVGVWTKLLLPDETFDTNSNYINSTFTPTVAGYYWIRVAAAQMTAGSQLGIYKSGFLNSGQNAGTGSGDWLEVSSLLYCNGTTDTIEAWAYAPSGMNFIANTQLCQFQAFLARAA